MEQRNKIVMQSNARMGGNAAEGGYKPAVKKNGGIGYVKSIRQKRLV